MGGFWDKLAKTPLALTFDDILVVPKYSDLKPSEINISTRITNRLKLKIPLLSSPMDTVTGESMVLTLGRLGGIGILPRNVSLSEIVKIIDKAKEENVPVGVAVGPFDDKRVKILADKNVDVIVIDTAHGHSKNVIEATRRFKEYGVDVMSGNIVTSDAANALIDAGADALRVGIGPGHACITREIAGVGMPQLTAIALVSDVARERGVGVIADGGIEKPADILKALAVGADAVMLGWLLAGTDEAPGDIIEISGKKYKKYRGMGSKGALQSGSVRYGEFKRVPEGVEGLVEYKGSVVKIVDYLVNGLKQGMGYVGAKNLDELREKAEFVRLTYPGILESRPRGLIIGDFK